MAENYKPKIDTESFLKKMKEKTNVNHLYSNEIKKESEIFKQEFFREKYLDSQYTNFNILLVDYAYYELNGIVNYEYTESFVNCVGKSKVAHRTFFDNNGSYIKSRIYILNFDDENLPVNEIICNKKSGNN